MSKIRYISLIICLQIFSCSFAQTTSWLMSDAELFGNINLDSEGMEQVKHAVKTKDYEQAKKALLDYKRTSCTAKWFAGPFTQTVFGSTLTNTEADSICNHYLKDDINSTPYVDGWVYMGDDFDWMYNPRESSDPAYGKQWTWVVVARTISWNKLADAYRETQNDKYISKWIWFLNDFIEDNPLQSYSTRRIPLVWRPLETAIRARTWIYTYLTFRNSALFSPENNSDYLKTIYAHGTLLNAMQINNPDRTGNHVTTECSALYVLSCVFPEFKDAEIWRQTALDRFRKEIDRVVPPDGMQAELSPSYHYGVVGTYKNIYDISRLNNIKLPALFISRLQDMYRAPVLIMDQQGDFVKTNDSNPRNIRASSKTGLELGYDPLLAWAASGGKDGKAPPTSTVLDYAGFYMMRSGWSKDDTFLFFRGGPQGIGHAEQEMLQIVLKAWGKTLLFDPGKYTYDQSDWRRFSINTPSHNTIIVDGKWQYREKVIPAEYLPVDNPWHVSPLFDFVSAEYDAGYVTNVYDPTKDYHPQKWMNDRDTSITHVRSILFLKPHYVLVFDQLNGSGNHVFDAHFHIDATDAVFDNKKNMTFSASNDSIQLAVFSLENNNLTTEIIKGQKDPLLGWYPVEQRPIPTLRFRKEQEAPAVFATFLYPYKNNLPAFKSDGIKLRNKALWGQHISTDEESAEIVFCRGRKTEAVVFNSKIAGNVNAETNGLTIRKWNDQNAKYVGAWDLLEYKDKTIALDFEKPATVTFFQENNGLNIMNTGREDVKVFIRKPFEKEALLPSNTWIRITKTDEHIIDAPSVFNSFINY